MSLIGSFLGRLVGRLLGDVGGAVPGGPPGSPALAALDTAVVMRCDLGTALADTIMVVFADGQVFATASTAEQASCNSTQVADASPALQINATPYQSAGTPWP